MPNKERIKLLVDALRSGKYIQGKNVLTQMVDNQDRDCCLGVACKVAIENGLELSIMKNQSAESEYDTSINNCVRYERTLYTLPGSVKDWYGFLSINPTLQSDSRGNMASVFNDEFNYTFDQIADLFEKTYL